MAALLGLPGALVAYTGFNAGGFFAGAHGVLAVLLALALVLRVTLARDPLAGASRTLMVAAVALGLYTAWVLASVLWSGAPGRALVEFDRALVYLLALLLFGTLPMTAGRLSWMLRGVALALLVVSAVGFVSRTLPDVLPTTPSVGNVRLSYPVTYWNTMGLVGVLGALFSLHLTASEREPAVVRVLAAAGVPVLAATVYLTFSRGAIVAGALALIVYLLLGRPRLLVSGLVAAGSATTVSVAVTYRAGALAAREPSAPLAVAQGHRVALVVALCALGAAGLRALFLAVDARIVRRPAGILSRPVRLGGLGLAAAVALVAFFSVGAPGIVASQYEVFTQPGIAREGGDLRDRFGAASSNGRIDLWQVAWRAFGQRRLSGHGAGTFQTLWNRTRSDAATNFDAHSLYLESLAELGVVGLALLVVALLSLLVGIARRIRGLDRALFAVLFAAASGWALRAGADWDWEMPVVTLWLFALGGAALATPAAGVSRPAVQRPGPSRTVRVLVGVGCLVLALTPGRMGLSQHRLNAGVKAFERGDCRRAIDASLGSIEAMPVRSEPYELIGLCDAGLGYSDLSVRAMQAAVRRDPQHWKYHYGLALVQAAAGRDPRPAARRALRLNPREQLAKDGVLRFATDDSREWVRQARSAPLP